MDTCAYNHEEGCTEHLSRLSLRSEHDGVNYPWPGLLSAQTSVHQSPLLPTSSESYSYGEPLDRPDPSMSSNYSTMNTMYQSQPPSLFEGSTFGLPYTDPSFGTQLSLQCKIPTAINSPPSQSPVTTVSAGSSHGTLLWPLTESSSSESLTAIGSPSSSVQSSVNTDSAGSIYNTHVSPSSIISEPFTIIGSESPSSNVQSPVTPDYAGSRYTTHDMMSPLVASFEPLTHPPKIGDADAGCQGDPLPAQSWSYQYQHGWFKAIVQKELKNHHWGPFVPQRMYRPHTGADRQRYVEHAELEPPIFFEVRGAGFLGVPLKDALQEKTSNLISRDESVFRERGPSVSIRILWPGYQSWSRQIPTKDFKKQPRPITRAKLAKSVAKSIGRFIEEAPKLQFECDVANDRAWKIRTGGITMDDLILVSLHHVSMGSWQPHLRLKRK